MDAFPLNDPEHRSEANSIAHKYGQKASQWREQPDGSLNVIFEDGRKVNSEQLPEPDPIPEHEEHDAMKPKPKSKAKSKEATEP